MSDGSVAGAGGSGFCRDLPRHPSRTHPPPRRVATVEGNSAVLLPSVRGHEKVLAGGQLRSPLVAMRSPRWWPAEVPTSR